nr:TetR-like C-terminal domain-containing protein [Eubacterium sp. 1001713B170207_170306_E7]
MGLIVELTQRYSAYMSVLLSDRGDPSFGTRLKELIWPLLNRYLISTKDLKEEEQALLSEFYLSGLLSAITKWLNEPGDMTIDQFIGFVMQHIFAGLFTV